MEKELEFDILGQKIRFKASEESNIEAKQVVACVEQTVVDLRKLRPNMSNGQMAVLLALKFAQEKLELEKEYRDNISKIQSGAMDALSLIEEVSPTAQ